MLHCLVYAHRACKVRWYCRQRKPSDQATRDCGGRGWWIWTRRVHPHLDWIGLDLIFLDGWIGHVILHSGVGARVGTVLGVS